MAQKFTSTPENRENKNLKGREGQYPEITGKVVQNLFVFWNTLGY